MRESIQKCHHPGKRGRMRSRFAKVLIRAEKYRAMLDTIKAADELKVYVLGVAWTQTGESKAKVEADLKAYEIARAKAGA